MKISLSELLGPQGAGETGASTPGAAHGRGKAKASQQFSETLSRALSRVNASRHSFVSKGKGAEQEAESAVGEVAQNMTQSLSARQHGMLKPHAESFSMGQEVPNGSGPVEATASGEATEAQVENTSAHTNGAPRSHPLVTRASRGVSAGSEAFSTHKGTRALGRGDDTERFEGTQAVRTSRGSVEASALESPPEEGEELALGEGASASTLEGVERNAAAPHGSSTTASGSGTKRARNTRGVANETSDGGRSSEGDERPSRAANKAGRPKINLGEPTLPPVSLAATRAATPLVKEIHAPERGRRAHSAERVNAASSSTKQEHGPVAAPPAAASTSPVALLNGTAPRPTSTIAPADHSASTARAAAIVPLPDLPAEGAVLQNAAHLRIESPGLGEISLHLRVRDGVAQVRFDGEKAAVLQERAPELARALASEGLSLGRIDPPAPTSHAASTGGDGAGQGRGMTTMGWEQNSSGNGGRDREPDDAEGATPAPAPRSQRRGTTGTSSKLHVQA